MNVFIAKFLMYHDIQQLYAEGYSLVKISSIVGANQRTVSRYLAIEIDTSLPAERVIRVLGQVIEWRGKPRRIRVDNGPEFISTRLTLWCEERGIQLQFIQPGKPTQNAYIERFSGSFRKDVLDAYLFENLHQVRSLTDEWMEHYNYDRPHDALGGRSPADMLAVDLCKTRDEFPTKPQPVITMITNEIV